MAMSYPSYTDTFRGSAFILMSPIIAGALLIYGAWQGDVFTIGLGVAGLVFVWLTRHRRYEVYEDRLVVQYGQPRRSTLRYHNIADVQLVKLSLSGGVGVFVRKKKYGGVLLRPSDPEALRDAINQARRKAKRNKD